MKTSRSYYVTKAYIWDNKDSRMVGAKIGFQEIKSSKEYSMKYYDYVVGHISY